VFINCIYATVKLVKCCILVCYVQLIACYLLILLICGLSADNRDQLRYPYVRPVSKELAFTSLLLRCFLC